MLPNAPSPLLQLLAILLDLLPLDTFGGPEQWSSNSNPRTDVHSWGKKNEIKIKAKESLFDEIFI